MIYIDILVSCCIQHQPEKLIILASKWLDHWACRLAAEPRRVGNFFNLSQVRTFHSKVRLTEVLELSIKKTGQTSNKIEQKLKKIMWMLDDSC